MNGYGNLGTNSTTYTSSPVQVGSLTSWTVVSAGKGSSIGIESGKLYAWGQNDHGQNGDNTRINSSSPTQIGSSTTWTDVVKGRDQALALSGAV
jgi:alpha-tubulin suppressor-like RCC1 family protein